MDCVILGAESTDLEIDSGSRVLTQINDEVIQLERQVHVLALLGFIPQKIFVVLNQKQLANPETLRIVSNLPCDLVEIGPTQSSADTFLAYIDKRPEPKTTLVLFGDSTLGTGHLEKLIRGTINNSLLVRSPMRLTESGLKIHRNNKNEISVSFNHRESVWPWNVFSGALIIDAETVSNIVELRRTFESGTSIVEALVEASSPEAIQLVDADRPAPQTSISWMNSELKGGSFASLERKETVVKRASGPASQKLQNEIRWLETLPTELKPNFTQILSSRLTPEHAEYEMPYYSFPSLRNSIISGAISVPEAGVVVDKLLQFLFGRVYSRVVSRDRVGWYETKHLDRVVARSMSAAKISPTLSRLVKARRLVVNGREVANPLEVVQRIREDTALLGLLEPRQLTMVHGDLHFQNILITRSNENFPFVLVDPRGELDGSDLYYDIGKLFHSFRGNYDLLHTNQFELRILDSTKKPTECKTFEAQFSFTSAILESRYAEIQGTLTPLILRHLNDFGETFDNARLKSLIAEGMHFSSLMPFHSSGTEPEEKAVSMFLTGAVLLDDFMRNSK